MLAGRGAQGLASSAALRETQPGLLSGGAGSCSARSLPLPIPARIARQPFQASWQEPDCHRSAALARRWQDRCGGVCKRGLSLLAQRGPGPVACPCLRQCQPWGRSSAVRLALAGLRRVRREGLALQI